MKHKHAELIKAWADGAKIEYEDCGWYEIENPCWDVATEYRIKDGPMDEQRKRFEACYSNCDLERNGDSYMVGRIADMWDAWQAAINGMQEVNNG